MADCEFIEWFRLSQARVEWLGKEMKEELEKNTARCCPSLMQKYENESRKISRLLDCFSNRSAKAIDHITTHSADLSKLLSFDKTITSKINWAVFFRKYHSLNDNSAFSKIECVEYV